MSAVKPAVILKTKFVLPNAKEYQGYVKYIDREEAKMKIQIPNSKSEEGTGFGIFHTFMDYMGDTEKEGELFTATEDVLTYEQKLQLRKDFTAAEKKESPMWQDVISFDNEWLEEQGLYDSKSHWLNESMMRDVVRATMQKMIEKESMRAPLWTASFHYNTDNIHVHVATVELEPKQLARVSTIVDEEITEQFRGKRKQETLDAMKSVVASKIVDRIPALKKIDELIRGTVTKKRSFDVSQFEETAELFTQALAVLPADLKQWQYGYQTINEARPYIDKIADIYLATFHKDEMEELTNVLDEQVFLAERLYGADSKHKQYKQNKLADLRKRMGNAVLQEMREYQKKLMHSRTRYENSEQRYGTKSKEITQLQQKFATKYQSYTYYQNRGIHSLKQAVYKLNQVMHKNFHEHQKDRNLAEFDRMLEGEKN